ncbi:MAG: thiopurine S-methyltransferase [Hyphomicrobiaceae bacterium]
MDQEFWHRRWRKGEIGFHRDSVHPKLVTFWSRLTIPSNARVFVPLCGKSLDMIWLAEQGHSIIGVELSEQAIGEFFASTRYDTIAYERRDGFSIHRAGPYELWCGDIFGLPADVLESIGAVYDRASLVAFPSDMRPRYARFMHDRIPSGTPTLLISLAFDQNEMAGPPFAVPEGEIGTLYGDAFDIEIVEREDSLAGDPGLAKRGLTHLVETVSLLTRR